jgi:hypothetical protein
VPDYIRLSQIYESIPLSERLCGKLGNFFQENVGCRKPVVRNAILIDGVIMHYGCFKKSYFEPTHMCNNCGSFLTPKKIVTVLFRGENFKSCGLCGSSDIFSLGWNRQQTITVSHQKMINELPEQIRIEET